MGAPEEHPILQEFRIAFFCVEVEQGVWGFNCNGIWVVTYVIFPVFFCIFSKVN